MVCKPLLHIADYERLKTYTSFYFVGTRMVIDKTQKFFYKLEKLKLKGKARIHFFLSLEINIECHK